MKWFVVKAVFLISLLVFPGLGMGADGTLGLPEMSFKMAQGEGLSTTIKIIILMTVLTLLPAIALMMTSFTRFIIVFSLLRHAMGLQQTPPNQILIGISLFMTFFVMTPVFDNVYTNALEPYMNRKMDETEAFAKGIEPFRKFMLAQTKEKELALFVEMSGSQRPSKPEDVKTSVLIPAFITSELKSAFQIGFILFIPFLIIDMVVASVLMSMGMFMLPPVLISLPFKIMLFVLVDGWALLIGSMIRSFNP
ncbi:MAG: flagellar type III secretion system pore protein FliP [Deltaproteobacteria bacterium]|nr:flagellar type III secretion system pore protein FliP [Deltaproteobacteria bacterium]